MNKTELEEYFKSDKSSWFKINEKGVKEWDFSKVNEFWDLIRQFKMKVVDLNFENYRFPKFNGLTFWEKGEYREFNQNVNFRYAIFQGYTEFQGVKFKGYADFIEANFIDLTSFNVTSFLLQVNFYNARFYNEVNFIVANFEKGVFTKTSFAKKAEFNNSHLKNTTFEGCNFNGMLNFTDAEFIENTLFYNTRMNDAIFDNINLTNSKLKFENIKFQKESIVLFRNIYLKENVIFKNCNMTSIAFNNCNIEKPAFFNCDWNYNSRLILKDEEITKEDFKAFFPKLKEIEESYRQLKNYFENEKNWELSSLAYVSEMEIRKKRLFIEKSYLPYFFYWFYGYFGGYTHNFTKPFLWFLNLTFVIAPIAYLFGYYFSFENNLLEIKDFNYLDALRQSLTAGLPFINSNILYDSWWAMSLQTIFSGILLTFIILALRKKFK